MLLLYLLYIISKIFSGPSGCDYLPDTETRKKHCLSRLTYARNHVSPCINHFITEIMIMKKGQQHNCAASGRDMIERFHAAAFAFAE